MTDWTDVCAVDELPPGHWKVVDVEGTDIAVFNVDGAFHAIEDVCTHDGACLTGLPIEGDQIICPRHEARFSLTTGEALTAPAYDPVDVFPVEVEDGRVRVRDDRWD
ncbi:MAG: Rieske (2Fe-2S) protein [Gammaproteobacteria bacterium]